MISNKRIRKGIVCLLSIFISFYVALFLRFKDIHANSFLGISNSQVFIYLLGSFMLIFLFYPFDKARSNNRGLLRHFKDALVINIMMLLIFSTLIYVSYFGRNISRLFLAYFFITDTLVMFIGFRILKKIWNYYEITHRLKAVVIVSENSRKEVLKNLHNYGDNSLDINALITIKDNNYKYYKVAWQNGKSKLTSTNDDYLKYLRREIVDVALIGLPNDMLSKVSELVNLMDELGIESYVSLSEFRFGEFETRSSHYGKLSVIEFAPRLFSESEILAKRIVDVIGSIIGCVLCIIVGIFVAPAIFIEDPGPVIFKQRRVGKNGRYFNIYKFRSMYKGAPQDIDKLKEYNEMNGPVFKIKDDPRITKVGKIIRRTSLDEFPQFFNVLKGDMSIVGTRPPTVEEFKKYSTHHKRRLSMKPGITGLWQISGRNEISDFEEIVKLDCYYIDNWSLSWDLKIIFQTIGVVLKRRGSS